MTTIDQKYLDLIANIRENGHHLDGRNGGTQTLCDEFPQLRWDLRTDSFPLLGVRKQNFLHYINEYLWEINGGHNIHELNGVHVPDLDSRFIWDPWAHPETGEVPYSYGACWRSNGHETPGAEYGIDQIQMLEDQLLAAVPSSGEIKRNRRLTLITADVFKNALDADNSFVRCGGHKPQVPPCHPSLSLTMGPGRVLNMHVFSRSQDVVCGLPGDMIRYSLMLMCFARYCGLEAGNMCFSFTDVHYYKEHEEKLMRVISEYVPNEFNNPRVRLLGDREQRLNEYTYEAFKLSGYYPSKFTSFPVIP
jgi:thymidylate synthase